MLKVLFSIGIRTHNFLDRSLYLTNLTKTPSLNLYFWWSLIKHKIFPTDQLNQLHDHWIRNQLLKNICLNALSSPVKILISGYCQSYCDPGHAFCGSPEMIEVSLTAFLPSKVV